jgi:NAD(P)-dependent dehydrogenase (short-subunit alcohol dehydrogenase family)
MSTSEITGKAVLVTGANLGLGRELVEEAVRRGAAEVYAAARQPITHPDERVTPVIMDVTDPAQIQAAAERVASLDILINNAGVSVPDDLSDRSAFERHLAVNLYGTLDVTSAFLPKVTERRGRIVNVISLAAAAAVPVLPAYSVSKAAQLSLTQSLRALVASDGRQRPSGHAGADRHRHDPRPPRPENRAGVGGEGHLRRHRARRRGDLPRPDGGNARRGLARGGGQGARAPERAARPAPNAGGIER